MRIDHIKLLLFGAIAASLFTSCHNYYKATTVSKQNVQENGAVLDSVKVANRYVILHNGMNDAYHAAAIQLSQDRKTAALLLESVGEQHRYYLSQGENSGARYRKFDVVQKGVISEAHVYIPYDPEVKPGSYTLLLDKIVKMEVLQHDAKRSTNSYVLGGLGLVAGGLAIATVIVFATIPYD